MKTATLRLFILLLTTALLNSCGFQNDAVGRTYQFLCTDIWDNCEEGTTKFNYSFDAETGAITIETINNKNINNSCQNSFIGTYTFNSEGEDGVGFYQSPYCSFVRNNSTPQSQKLASDIKVCYDDAYAFAEKRCNDIGQQMIAGNVTKDTRWFIKFDDANTGTIYSAPSYLYYFMSAPLDMSDYCISVISDRKLKVIKSDCGDPYDMQEQWKYKQWSDDPCK